MSEKRNILIVVNPAAGKAEYEKRLRYLKDALRKAGVSFEQFLTEHNDAGRLRKAVQGDSSINEIFVLGGDGTLNYVVNELPTFDLPLSIVSIGTGNDSVKSLHGVVNFKEQVRIALTGKVEHFDLGICNGRYFVNGVGIGFDGEVVREMIRKGSKKGRHIDYLLTVVRILAGFKEKQLRFLIDGAGYSKRILLMTISNGTTFGGGFVLNPFASTSDGFLDVCIFNEISAFRRFWSLPRLKSGTHYKIKEAEFHQAYEITIEPNDQLVAHMDGEFIGYPPFEIEIRQQVLPVRVPASLVSKV